MWLASNRANKTTTPQGLRGHFPPAQSSCLTRCIFQSQKTTGKHAVQTTRDQYSPSHNVETSGRCTFETGLTGHLIIPEMNLKPTIDLALTTSGIRLSGPDWEPLEYKMHDDETVGWITCQ